MNHPFGARFFHFQFFQNWVLFHELVHLTQILFMLRVVDRNIGHFFLLFQTFPLLWSNRCDLSYRKILRAITFYSIFLRLYISNKSIHRGFGFLLENFCPKLILFLICQLRKAFFHINIVHNYSFLFSDSLFRHFLNIFFLRRSQNRNGNRYRKFLLAIFVVLEGSCNSFEANF